MQQPSNPAACGPSLAVAYLCHAVVQPKGIAQGKHLLPHQQVGRRAQRDRLELCGLLLRALQLQHGHILVRVSGYELHSQQV